jgi:nitronate monooxygenase/enoyl-[acyl-carrier protein] reductase II
MTALRTPLCDQLGIDVPILSVGFGISAGPALVAAVSNAGGGGVLGGSGVPRAALEDSIRAVRKLTGRPFGVNNIIADFDAEDSTDEDRAYVADQVTGAIEARVAFIVLFWGPADPFVDEAHRAGVKVLIQVGSVREAEAAARAGVDAVIAQGIEAGGHVRGATSIWDLLPATVAALAPLPVLASGGIGDGAGIARALELGAQGVSLGTRFVASDEAFIHPLHKQRVVESNAGDTVYGALFDVNWPDAPHRVLRNKVVREWEAAGRPPRGRRPNEDVPIGRSHRPWTDFEWPRYAPGMITPDFEGDPDYAPMWAGESCSVVNDIKPAAEIVRDLARDAEAALARTAARLG